MQLFKNVCGVIDAQGYVIDGVFYPKEVAGVNNKLDLSILCDIHLKREDLSEEDKRTVDWAYKYHGLPLESTDDYWFKMSPKDSPQVYSGIDVVLAMYQWMKTDEKPYVAVKNPQLVQILQMWDIPYVEFPERSHMVNRHLFQILANNTCGKHKLQNTKCAHAKAKALWNVIMFKFILK